MIVLLLMTSVPPLTYTPPPPPASFVRTVAWLPLMLSPVSVTVSTVFAMIPPPPGSPPFPPVTVSPEIVTEVEAGGITGGITTSNTELLLPPLIVRLPAPGPEIVRLCVIISAPLVSVIV